MVKKCIISVAGLGDKWEIYKASSTLVTVNGNTTNSKSDPHKSKPSEKQHLAKQTHKPVDFLLFSDVTISLYRITVGQKQHTKPFLQLYPLSKTLIPGLSGLWPFKAKQCLLTTSRHTLRGILGHPKQHISKHVFQYNFVLGASGGLYYKADGGDMTGNGLGLSETIWKDNITLVKLLRH